MPSKSLAVLATALVLNACVQQWEAVPIAPREYVEQEGGEVRLTDTTGDRITLAESLVRNDSILEQYRRCPIDYRKNRPICEYVVLGGMPIDQIELLERRKSPGVVGWLVGVPLGVGVFIGLIYLFGGADWDFPYPDSYR